VTKQQIETGIQAKQLQIRQLDTEILALRKQWAEIELEQQKQKAGGKV